jgi:hypothetical protein
MCRKAAKTLQGLGLGVRKLRGSSAIMKVVGFVPEILRYCRMDAPRDQVEERAGTLGRSVI